MLWLLVLLLVFISYYRLVYSDAPPNGAPLPNRRLG